MKQVKLPLWFKGEVYKKGEEVVNRFINNQVGVRFLDNFQDTITRTNYPELEKYWMSQRNMKTDDEGRLTGFGGSGEPFDV